MSEVPGSSDRPDDLNRIRDLVRQRNQLLADPFQVRERVSELINPDMQKKKEQIEKVRSTTLKQITVEDILRPGGVKDSYDKAWITAETVALLKEHKFQEFQQRTRKGVMVFGFDERPSEAKKRNSPSVFTQMQKDFKNAEDGKKELGTYTGYSLVNEQNEIIAWATWLQPPAMHAMREKGTLYHTKMKNYLSAGVTGGQMNYFHKNFGDFRDAIPETLYFDTIVSNETFGAHRLFAEITKKMMSEQKGPDDLAIQHFILYRLQALNLRTKYGREFDSGLVQVGGNMSSDRFFSERGCNTFAADFNPAGPNSKRIIDGKEYRLRPTWTWMSGYMKDVVENSQIIWQKLQQQYGSTPQK